MFHARYVPDADADDDDGEGAGEARSWEAAPAAAAADEEGEGAGEKADRDAAEDIEYFSSSRFGRRLVVDTKEDRTCKSEVEAAAAAAAAEAGDKGPAPAAESGPQLSSGMNSTELRKEEEDLDPP